jgi:L-lactate dehydrogenase complex protein LldG
LEPEEEEMSEREKILGRIREALRLTAPRPGDHGGHGGHDPAPVRKLPVAGDMRRWLPLVGDTLENRAEVFAAQSMDLRTEFCLLESTEAAHAKLKEVAQANSWAQIASHRGALTDAACASLGMPPLLTDSGYTPPDLERCDAGISECDALIAQTGSVLITARSAGGRALSVLPPHHVVLARREQLLPDLPAAFALLREKYGRSYPSFMSLITGPSRTGDIERILVLGAHGPKKLTVLCW